MTAVIRVTCESSFATLAVNAWHWRIPEANTATEVSGILTALDTFYEAIDANLAPATWTIGSRVVTVDQSPNEEIFASALTCVTSGATNGFLGACAVVSHRGAAVGARYRGRKYIGPLTAAALASNGRELSSGTLSTISTAFTTLGGFTTNGVEFGVWSEKFSQFTPSTVFAVRTQLGTQRRRVS